LWRTDGHRIAANCIDVSAERRKIHVGNIWPLERYPSRGRPTRSAQVTEKALLLGVDGGGTRCRVRLCAPSGAKLGEAVAGPANIRYGLEQSFSAVFDATAACLTQAGLSPSDLSNVVACLALAGASEPADLVAAQRHRHPFAKAVVTNDAHAACVGAHRGRDGGIIVIGTGSIGWAQLAGRHHRVGGWGWPVSDEGSGAWLGAEAVRRVLWAHDGRVPWTALGESIFQQFGADPHAIVQWMARATPGDYATLAPRVVEYAGRDDAAAIELMRLAGRHIDALAARLAALGVARLALAGGLAPHVEPWLSDATRRRLVSPEGDALEGALWLARAAA
jgi:glucosamine kinase